MNNVTLIDDLPNLDDLEPNNTHINSGLSMIPSSEVNKYQKFIRNSGMKTPIESGMQINKPTRKPIMNKINIHEFPDYNIPGKYNPYIPSTYENFDISYNPSYSRKISYEDESYNPSHSKKISDEDITYNPYYSKKISDEDISCIQVSHHAENCTVCSKLYSNNNMVFIFIIIFQAVIILLLIKKILE
jgi:hypothetical protein